MNVWILQTGEPLHVDGGEPRGMRAMNLADALVDAGHHVVVWSAAFSHQERRHRTRTYERREVAPRLEYRLVPSPGYARNIGPGRLWDHAVLGANLKRALRGQTPPDVCLIGYPPIETAAVMARWLRERGVPSLLDAKDQWPTLFVEALPRAARIPGRVLLAPYYRLARRAMRDATGLAAMADGFLAWARAFSGRAPSRADLVAPLTSRERTFSDADRAAAHAWWATHGVSPDGTPRACFVGTHSRSFDFRPVVEAARALEARNVRFEIIACGAGEATDAWKTSAAGVASIRFPGWVSPVQVKELAGMSIAFLAPYIGSDDFERSIPNKVVDALSLGLPVVTPLRGEVAHLIEAHGVGLRYGGDSGHSLADRLAELFADPSAQREMARRARALYEERFTFERVYGGLVRHLEQMARTATARRQDQHG